MTESFNPAFIRKPRERGYALITALILALLYFALMELVWIESTDALRGANRFRSTVLAEILAQNGAELVAEEMVARSSRDALTELPGGGVVASYRRMPDFSFEIRSTALSSGPFRVRRSLVVAGTIIDGNVSIVRTSHDR